MHGTNMKINKLYNISSGSAPSPLKILGAQRYGCLKYNRIIKNTPSQTMGKVWWFPSFAGQKSLSIHKHLRPPTFWSLSSKSLLHSFPCIVAHKIPSKLIPCSKKHHITHFVTNHKICLTALTSGH